jgi:hypothetical protein
MNEVFQAFCMSFKVNLLTLVFSYIKMLKSNYQKIIIKKYTGRMFVNIHKKPLNV